MSNRESRAGSIVAGVDGCKAGWLVVLRDAKRSQWTDIFICNCFHEVVDRCSQCKIVGIDIPIGLLDSAVAGGRVCDKEARILLGAPRKSSVFSPPSRQGLREDTFELACQQNGEVGISIQCFSLFPKLREVDKIFSADLQKRFKEVHPEVCFYQANGCQPMAINKKKREGQKERLEVLARNSIEDENWGEWWSHASNRFDRRFAAIDDILDAHIACWTAERITKDKAIRIPNNPPCDTKSLRMEMWR